MTSDADASTGNAGEPDTVRVVSRGRPIPVSAQMELQEYGLIRTERHDDGSGEVAYLRRRPPAEFLETHGLAVPDTSRELWRGPRGRLIEIRPDAVLIDDTETDIDPREARQYVRSGNHEPVEVPDEN